MDYIFLFFFTQNSYICDYQTTGLFDFDLRLYNWSYSLFSFHGDWKPKMHASNIRHCLNPPLYSVGESLNAWFQCQCFLIVFLFFTILHRDCEKTASFFFTCRSYDHELLCASLSSSALLCWYSSSIMYASFKSPNVQHFVHLKYYLMCMFCWFILIVVPTFL